MKIYIFILIFFFIVGSYFAGARVSSQKCKTQIAELNVQNQSTIIKTVEKINEKTFNTSVYDIRHFLREQYTIAE